MKALLVLLGFSLLVLFTPGLRAEDAQPAAKPAAVESPDHGCFVDMDGDGFSDNLPDENGDGIPDLQKADAQPQAESEAHASADAAATAFAIGPLRSETFEEVLPCSQKFSAHKFATRAICLTRGGLDAGEGFGGTGGIGLGAVNGCPGGVCRPH